MNSDLKNDKIIIVRHVNKYGSNEYPRDLGSVGCYWSGTAHREVSAMDLLIFGSTTDLKDSRNRANGMLIRPVTK